MYIETSPCITGPAGEPQSLLSISGRAGEVQSSMYKCPAGGTQLLATLMRSTEISLC